MLDFSRFEVISFDCYGTLIDWERGILGVLKPVLARHGRMVPDEDALALYARAESAAEAGDFVRYADVLRRTMEKIAAELGITLSGEQRNALVASLPAWPPFDDTVEALRGLAPRFRLAVVSNVDDDLFDGTRSRLGVPIDTVVTAESAGAYKPSIAVFEAARARLGVAKEAWLHVAQSLWHDIAPARSFGLATVWIDRRAGRPGSGATPRCDARPDLRLESLAHLAALVQGE